jgi:hypothetical protein
MTLEATPMLRLTSIMALAVVGMANMANTTQAGICLTLRAP